MTYDLKITDCNIIDGTGRPGYRGDIGVRGGRVVALGKAPEDATRVIRAAGRVACPGFVDIHTHYDAQVLWDRMLTPSHWHGVTSVVMGNCGFTLAPTRPEHRDLILRTFERVEAMDLSVLNKGIGKEWGFTHFTEYLQRIESRGLGLNVAGFIGHTPLRLYVMGEAAVEREATDAEIAAMQNIVREALRAGALGFATTTASAHHGFDGKPVPSRLAGVKERLAMATVLREEGKGIYYYNGQREPAWDEFAAIGRECGRTVIWGVLLSGQLGPGMHRTLQARNAELVASGVKLYAQGACRPIVFEYSFDDPAAFATWAYFQPIRSARSREDKLRLLADENFRRLFREEVAGRGGNDKFFGGGEAEGRTRRASFTLTEVSWFPPDRSLENRKVADIARERNVPPTDLMYDLSIQTSMEARFRTPVSNFDEDEVEEILRDPNVIVGLGDAGAHTSQLFDGCYATHLLGHWVRERKSLGLEQAVHMLTGKPASVYGIADRGLLAEGRPADITVFDPDTISAGKLERVRDFPGGAERIVSRPSGIGEVIVNGTPMPPPGETLPAGAKLPGKLLRA